MKARISGGLLVLTMVCIGSRAVEAQQIVHAVSGVVTAVNPAKNLITIKTNDDSEGVFQYRKDLKANILFDKDVRSGTMAPEGFNKVGDHVVAYYFGDDYPRIVVALKDFGATPLSVASGTVVKAKHHAIVLKTDAGETETFDIAKDASAETSTGVVSGFHLDVNEGTHATVRYTETNGMKTAQYIRAD
jgi:hypothetical protein